MKATLRAESKLTDPTAAVRELANQLNITESSAVIFFVSGDYDLQELGERVLVSFQKILWVAQVPVV